MSYPTMSTSVPWGLVKGGFKKSPDFNTVYQKTGTGRGDSSYALKPYPTWNFELDLAYVLGGEGVAGSILQSFLGTFIACCGGAGYFLFTDPNDNAVTTADGVVLNVTPGAAAPMGQVGDGTSTQFQLARTIGQGVDILQNVNGLSIYLDGDVTSAYTVSATGLVTFTSAPGEGVTITWAGSFQYLCRFTNDTLSDLARVSKNSSGWIWDCSSIKFESKFL